MRILVLGGTAFLSRAVAQAAMAAGWDVTCAARGISGEPPEDVRFIRWDRGDEAPPALSQQPFDAVIDVSGTPGHVRSAVGAFPDAHWIFISTISVYADLSQPQGRPEATVLLPAIYDDDAPDSAETYGGMKVACEELISGGTARWTIIRPGLIVGPGDPTGRFTYWPQRIADAAQDGEPVIAPAPTSARVQWIDVRDLAAWVVGVAESQTTGIFDAIGESVTRQDFIHQLSALLGNAAAPRWVSAETLDELGVQPWSGPRSIPLWIPWSGWEAMLDRDWSPAAEAGLKVRQLTETAADTLDWVTHHESPPNGLTRAEELALLERLATPQEPPTQDRPTHER